jgi:hypothetical protein
MYSCARLALCFMVPAFSLANGNESDSVLELDLKLASDPLRCCKARDAISSCSSLILTLTLPHERDMEEDGRFSCGGVEGAGVSAGGAGGG